MTLLFAEFAFEAIASWPPRGDDNFLDSERRDRGRRTQGGDRVAVGRAALSLSGGLGEAPVLTDPPSPVPGAVYPAANQRQRPLAYRSTADFNHMSDPVAADTGMSLDPSPETTGLVRRQPMRNARKAEM